METYTEERNNFAFLTYRNCNSVEKNRVTSLDQTVEFKSKKYKNNPLIVVVVVLCLLFDLTHAADHFRHSKHHWQRHRRSSSLPHLQLHDLHLGGANLSGTWPAKRVAEIDGDIVIGGLQMVHERQDKLICGPVMPQGGLQAAEAMLYTVDKVNELGILPKPLKLGAYVLDDCDKDTYGLQMAVDFIKGRYFSIALS